MIIRSFILLFTILFFLVFTTIQGFAFTAASPSVVSLTAGLKFVNKPVLSFNTKSELLFTASSAGKFTTGFGAFSIALNAQDRIISGQTTDGAGNIVPWVNIGIKNKNIGTVSNTEGVYQIRIPEANLTDTLSFSSVGFETAIIPLSKINSNQPFNIVLKETAVNLSAITITHKKPKIKKLGNTGYTPMIWAYVARNLNDITEQGKLILVKKPVRLLSAHVFTGSLKRKDSVSYRLNIYKVRDGYPSERLFEKSLIKKFPLTETKLSFDLSNESLVIDQDFLISFEYLPEKKSNKPPVISFRAGLGNSGGYLRSASLGQWDKIKGGSASIYVVVEE